ncbi:hypothetical protein [Sinomonas sp. P47F7]|uniref:hypothetical protein n=1 Tax=Sinomonas sp. P47F7 TaxID=3410987 RepID=UPI003BF50C56
MRVCDGLSTLEEVGAIGALTQCLVEEASAPSTRAARSDHAPWHVQENKWRAARYGLDAIIILDAAGHEQLVTEHLAETLDRLEPIARDLRCESELRDIEGILRRGAGYQRQRRTAERHGGDLRAVVLEEARLMRQGHPA